MKSEKKVEIVKEAIKQLLDEEEDKSDVVRFTAVVEEEEDSRQKAISRRRRQLLSELMSQLEEEEEESEIMEVKNVKSQNSITHCLLTAMIVVTLVWQLSEVSLILKIKNGFLFGNPFKSVTGIIKGFLKNHTAAATTDVDLPGLDIPHLELPGFDHHTHNSHHHHDDD